MRRLLHSGLAALALLAAPAVAQEAPVLDGKATLSGKAGEALSGAIATKDQMRGLIVAAIEDKMSPDEMDFFREVAAGVLVQTTVNGKMVRVGPLTGDALALAKLISAPPNLNTLYKARGEPMLQMIEISRWGSVGKERITGFMANKLYAAWQKSDIRNAYTAWVQEFAGINNAMMEIADPALKAEAKQLFKLAIEKVLVSCKADGREPPQAFLYNFPFAGSDQPRQPA